MLGFDGIKMHRIAGGLLFSDLPYRTVTMMRTIDSKV